jgi:YL1 nuclear protein C-terminal domain
VIIIIIIIVLFCCGCGCRPVVVGVSSSFIISIMSTAAARKAWNEAMKATAGVAALPPAVQQQVSPPPKRRSYRHSHPRHKSGIRNSSSKSTTTTNNATATTDQEQEEYKTWIWMDALEGIDPSMHVNNPEDQDKDDDDDEFGNITENDGEDDEADDSPEMGKGKKRKKKTTTGDVATNAKSKTTGKRTKKSLFITGGTATIPKRLLPKSLGTILLDEMNREDCTTFDYLAIEARHKKNHPNRIPSRKFCPVTGLLARYTHPKTGIPYATLSALEQILERPPPWMMLTGNHTATYYEAIQSIQQQQAYLNQLFIKNHNNKK